MVKYIPLFYFGLLFTVFLHAQPDPDSISNGEYFDNLERISPSAEENFIGFHGYYITSSEVMPVQPNIFFQLISDPDIPIVELSPSFHLAWMSFMKNWMYTSVSYSYSFTRRKENDFLVSKLTQYSLAARFGYNVVIKSRAVISPYFGLRYTRFRHLTSLKDENVSLDDYLSVRDIDLRVSQWSGELGINSTFLVHDNWSVGFYLAFLLHFSEHPTVRTKQNRITNRINNPVENFVLGIGFGMGLNDFNR